MTFLRLLMVGGMAFLLALCTSTAEAAKPKTHSVHGTVGDVHKNTGTLTLKMRAGKKQGATVPAQEVTRKFKVTKATRVEFVKGKKGAQEITPATLADVHNGEHVVMTVKAGVVEKIAIHTKGKKKV